MKKIVVILAGLVLGMILLIRNTENSLAVEEDSFFGGSQIISDDSIRIVSLREKAKDNSFYLEMGSAEGERVTGEFFSGALGAALSGCLGAKIGYEMGHEKDPGWFDEGSFEGGVWGYLIGSNLGCVTGVYLAGNLGRKKGSYLAAFGGSLVVTLLATPLVISIADKSDVNEILGPLALFTIAEAAGATVGFNLSKKSKKTETSSQALLNVNNGELNLTFPQVNVSLNSFGLTNYRINLFQAKF
jgi:hypothetical protein